MPLRIHLSQRKGMRVVIGRRHAGVLALENIGKAIELAAGVNCPSPDPVMAELMLDEARKWAERAKGFGAYEAGHTGELCALADIGKLLLKYGDEVKRRHAKFFGNAVFNAMALKDGLDCRTCEEVECQVYRTAFELLESELEETIGR